MPQIPKDESLDGELDLKKRSRRRLVGAAALALLAAIVLPMVMDREPRQPAQDVQVKIPSQDGGGSLVARVPPTKPAATPLPVPEADAKLPPAAKVEAKLPEVAKEVATVAPPVVDRPAPKVVEKATEKHVDKPVDKPSQSRAEDAKALAALNGATEAAAGTAEQWVVQLGAYKEAGNVKILIGKLKQMNIPAYTEDFESPQGARTRVRAGPFKSREAAEKAKSKIHILGVDGPVAAK